MNILLVEDEFLLAALLESQEKEWGHNIIKNVATGEQAVRCIKKYKPDLVIMDILLKGGMDGIEAVNEAQKTSNFEVIYITGHSDPEIKKRAWATNPIDIIDKPIELKQLKKTIDQIGDPA